MSYFRFIRAIFNLKKNEVIIVSFYGTYVDLGLLILSRISSTRVVLDVHEFIDENSNAPFLELFVKFGFKVCKNSVICHSDKVSTNLKLSGYNYKPLKTPHIHYEINRLFDSSFVGDDIKSIFEDGSVHFLFFGNIIQSKGINDLLHAVEKIDFTFSKAKIIIAGRDGENIIRNFSDYDIISKKISLILRYINDDEMKFLFHKTNFILLPYLDISQSGVLEMAINFRKPFLSSQINYFTSILNEYPSFGKSLNTSNPINFAKAINYESMNYEVSSFYVDSETNRYLDETDFNIFLLNLKSKFIID